MRRSDFVHLHAHSAYSLLDGVSQPRKLVQRALSLGHEALALTDHGAMYGTVEFYQAAKDAGIQPIIGCEVYVAARSRRDKEAQRDRKSHHLVLLARTNEGYKNLIQLVTKAHMEGFYYYPRVDHELLHRFGSGLVCLSGCLSGEIPDAITSGDMDGARALIEAYHSHFGAGNFFLEVQHHPDLPSQEKVNQGVFELAEEFGIPVVATNDSHYACTTDAEAQDALLCVQTSATLDQADRMSMMDGDYSLLSTEEMSSFFDGMPETITNTLRVAEMCNVEIELGKARLPKFPTPKNLSPSEYLRELCEEGLRKRYPLEKAQDGQWRLREGHAEAELPVPLPEILERLDYELGVIGRMGFDSYFLIVWDYVQYAKKNGIVVGPGRGSAAGALVTYVLGITELDPLRYDLLFERFLNPDRISMPDADVDFDDEHRDQVVEYVRQKYGRDCVANVITFGTMQAKGAIKDVGRAMGMTFDETDRIAKLVPNRVGVELSECLESEPEFRKAYEENPRNKKLVDLAMQLEGVTRHVSVHACAVVISDIPLENFTPLQYAPRSEDVIITQYEAHALESLGLLKMDFLGLRNLTVAKRATELIKRNHGVDVDLYNLPFDDPATYELLSRGETTAVFQLESSGMKRYLRELRPNRFEDIIAMVALYRPGPMQFIEEYCARKHGRAPIIYDHELMVPALESTYGITVYQEQVMQMSRELGGFTRGEADTLRKAMGKKIGSLMDQMKGKFVSGARERGIGEELATKIWGDWEKFASYAFNKSHAACYAFVAFQTAYLKTHYPYEFMAAALSSEIGDSKRIIVLSDECRRMGVPLLPPNVNKSELQFTVSKEGIRFGLLAVKNVGIHAIEAITHAREQEGPFSSLFDFCRRVDNKAINKRMIESLIKSGAMDDLGERAQMLAGLDAAINWAQNEQENRSRGQTSLFDAGSSDVAHGPAIEETTPTLPSVAPLSVQEKLEQERELLGFYVSGHPLDPHRVDIELFCSHSSEALGELGGDTPLLIAGIIRSIRRITTKAQKQMAVLVCEDFSGTFEVVVFPDVYEAAQDYLIDDQIVFVRGTRSRDEPKVMALEVIPITHARMRLAKAVDVSVASEKLTDDAVGELRRIIKAHGGTLPVYIHVSTKSHGRLRFRARSGAMNPTNDCLAELGKQPAVESVTLCPAVWEVPQPPRRGYGEGNGAAAAGYR